jgi:hypothetical protein
MFTSDLTNLIIDSSSLMLFWDEAQLEKNNKNKGVDAQKSLAATVCHPE